MENAPESIPTQEFLRSIWFDYVAIKKANNKFDEVTCTRCGKITKIPKKSKEYVCECGYRHDKLKNTRFENYYKSFVVSSLSTLNGEELYTYYLVRAYYSKEEQLIKFNRPLLIAKKYYFKEKKVRYFYNFAFMKTSYYQIAYSPEKNVTESSNNRLEPNCYYIDEMLIDFKYINYYDQNIRGWAYEVIKRNEYLIEILQKYNSSYLFRQLKNRTSSKKLIDLFGLRDANLSNKQVVMIIKYFSKYKNLDISIYQDYLGDLKMLGLKFNRYNLCNKDYKERHLELTKKVRTIQNAEKDKLLQKAYEGLQETLINGVYIEIPHSLEDLVVEGKKLNHCVGNGSYANKIIKGESKILFVRRKQGESLLTAEVDTYGKIKQLRGYGNREENVNFMLKAKRAITKYMEETNV
jgi:hypothetical protein